MRIFFDTNILIDWLFLKDLKADELEPLPKTSKASIKLYHKFKLIKK